jgi:hypothetical protein
MALKTKEHQEAPAQAPIEPEVTGLVRTDGNDLSTLFRRSANSTAPIKSITLTRTLTRPLLAAAHFEQLLFTCTSDLYIMSLPNKGRGGAPSPALVCDGINVANNEESTLYVNAMMLGGLERGGFRVMKPILKDGETTGFSEHSGTSLIGHSFAFNSGSVKEGKGYRTVDTVEVTIER